MYGAGAYAEFPYGGLTPVLIEPSVGGSSSGYAVARSGSGGSSLDGGDASDGYGTAPARSDGYQAVRARSSGSARR